MEEAKESETSSEARMASESTRGRHLFNSMVGRSKAIARKERNSKDSRCGQGLKAASGRDVVRGKRGSGNQS